MFINLKLGTVRRAVEGDPNKRISLRQFPDMGLCIRAVNKHSIPVRLP
jgi:RNA:NAD 2'-phosphotransferase (TPT1/KptA family)